MTRDKDHSLVGSPPLIGGKSAVVLVEKPLMEYRRLRHRGMLTLMVLTD